MTKYTFLLPAYKAQFFEEALRGIQNQTFVDFLVIVSDDCSPEPLRSIFDKVCSDDSRFTYTRNEKNLGQHNLVSHWNLLVNQCKTEYLVLASDDDVYGPDFLSEVDRLSIKYPEVDLIRAKVRNLNSKGIVCREESPSSEYVTQWEFCEQMFCREYYNCIANFAFKTRPLQEKGGFLDFPFAMNSDDATTLMMSCNGVANIQKTTFDFRLSGINISYPKKNEKLEIIMKKLDAANQYCLWLRDFQKDIFKRNTHKQVKHDELKQAMDFYLFCCTSSLLYSIPFSGFIKEFHFMHHCQLFSNWKMELKVAAKWLKVRMTKAI